MNSIIIMAFGRRKAKLAEIITAGAEFAPAIIAELRRQYPQSAVNLFHGATGEEVAYFPAGSESPVFHDRRPSLSAAGELLRNDLIQVSRHRRAGKHARVFHVAKSVGNKRKTGPGPLRDRELTDAALKAASQALRDEIRASQAEKRKKNLLG